MKVITNVSVNSLSSFHRNASASWSMKGARFHVWFNMDTLVLASERRIYKNPPLGVDRRHPDYFNTRYLRADLPKNQEIIRQVFSEIVSKGLIAAAIASQKDEERKKQAEQDSRIRDEKIKQAAPELLAALQACADFWKHGTPVHAGAHVAEDAIALLAKLGEA